MVEASSSALKAVVAVNQQINSAWHLALGVGGSGQVLGSAMQRAAASCSALNSAASAAALSAIA